MPLQIMLVSKDLQTNLHHNIFNKISIWENNNNQNGIDILPMFRKRKWISISNEVEYDEEDNLKDDWSAPAWALCYSSFVKPAENLSWQISIRRRNSGVEGRSIHFISIMIWILICRMVNTWMKLYE